MSACAIPTSKFNRSRGQLQEFFCRGPVCSGCPTVGWQSERESLFLKKMGFFSRKQVGGIFIHSPPLLRLLRRIETGRAIWFPRRRLLHGSVARRDPFVDPAGGPNSRGNFCLRARGKYAGPKTMTKREAPGARGRRKQDGWQRARATFFVPSELSAPLPRNILRLYRFSDETHLRDTPQKPRGDLPSRKLLRSY